MANQTQDVELRIRASNFSRKTTDEVVDALKKMVVAQDAQIEAAKKGSSTAAQLESSYQKLESAAKALLSQNSLIKLFQSQSATLSELETKLNSARKAQQDYQAASARTARTQGMSYNEFKSKNLADFTRAEGSHAAAMARISKEWANYKVTLDAGGQSQAKSAAEAEKLARAVASAEKQLALAEGRLGTTQKRLSEFGISAANASEQQQKIVAAVTNANAALARQEQAIAGHDAFAAQRRAAADMIAQREQQTRAAERLAQAERALAASLQVERRAQQESNEAAAMNRAAHDAQMEMLFSQEARKAAEALNRKTAALVAQRAALQAAAIEAERLTRASNNTARGAGPVSTPNLAGQIRDIQNPADAAVRSVAGLEAAVAGLERRVAHIRGPVKDYRGAVEEATRAQKALLAVAGQVDGYQRQITAVRASRAEFVAARAEVTRLVAEMRSGRGGDDVIARLGRAQGTMQQAAQRLGNLTTTARQMRAELQAAGVNTTNLANAEAGLVAQATRATTALNALNDAYRRNGAAADSAGSRIWNWFGGNNGRTTMSFMQRMRGEVLSLGASFIGLYAAISLAGKNIDAHNQSIAVMNRLLVVAGGDARKAADEFAWLQATADRIGVSFPKAAPAFAKLAIAAQMAGLNVQQTRYIFEGFATATARLSLSAIDTERVFKALEQMFNKGKVSAEELTHQLGDALPAALNQFAKARGVSVAEFTKLMENGAIGPEIILKVAKQLSETYGAINQGTTNLAQAQARFDNASTRFMTNTARGGFVEAYQKFLDRLTTMMNDGTADKFAQQLSAALTGVVNVMQFVVDNMDTFKTLLIAIMTIQFVKWLMMLPGLFLAVRTELILANGQLAIFQGWLARQQAAAALTTALGAGGLTGVIARLTPALVACGNALAFMGRMIPFVGAALLAYQGTRFLIDTIDDNTKNAVVKSIEATTKALQDATKAREQWTKTQGTKDEAAMKEQYERFRKIAVDAQRKQEEELAKAKKGGIVWDDITEGKVAEALQKQSRMLSERPKASDATPYPGDIDESPRQMLALQRELAKEQKRIERSAQNERLKAAKGDLAARLDLIDMEFDERREKARETFTNEQQLALALEAINKTSLAKQAVERAKFENEQRKSGESSASKRKRLAQEIALELEKIEDDIAKRQAEGDPTEPFETRRLARVNAIGHAYDELMKKIIRQQALDPKAAAEAEKKLKLLTQQRKDLEEQNAFRDEANRLLDDYNKKQGVLSTNIATFQAQADAGVISSEEAAVRINEQIVLLGEGINEAGQKALEFTVMSANMLDPTRFAEIVATIRQGMAKNNVDAKVAVNNLNEGQRQLNELLAMQAREIDAINLKRKLGALDPDQEIEAINAVTLKYAESIQFLAQNLIDYVAIVREKGGIKPEELAAIEAAATRVLATSKAGIVSAKEWETTLVNSVVNNGVNAFDKMAESIAKVIDGQQGIKEGFKGMMQAAGMFFAALLRDLAMAILRTQILKMLQNVPGPVGMAATAALAGGAGNVPVNHAGGVVGSAGGRRRSNVPLAAFIGAERFHNGGLPGFGRNEVPSVLLKGEEVLTRDDPRNILNLGDQVASAAATQPEMSQRLVLVDDRSRIPEAMASAEGEAVTLVHLKKNLPTLKQWLGRK